MKLPPDWSELIQLFCRHRVRFLIVGAHALAVHGRPRATGDLDLLIDPTPANARRVGQALQAFGFPALAAEAEKFAEPDRMATLGREPLRIDILNSISGVSFARAWRGKVRVPFGGNDVFVLGERELRENKRASGRPKDLLDLALLDEARAAEDRGRRRAKRRRAPTTRR